MQNKTAMNWDDGRLFLAVARTGQLLAAAKSLGLNQATLSRRMTAFEKQLGTRLLIRRTTGCELTDAGREMADALEQMETAFLSSQANIGDENASLSGTIRIGAPDGFGVSFLAPRLKDLVEAHPALKVELVPVPRTFSLSQREADIAVMIGRPQQGRVVARKLTDYSLSLYAAEAYLERHGVPDTPASLAGHRLIGYVEDQLYSPDLNYTGEFWRNWQSQVEIASATGQLEAARAGCGIAILHDYLAADVPELQRVLPHQQVSRTYWMVYHESLRDNARVRACADFLSGAVTAAKDQFSRGD